MTLDASDRSRAVELWRRVVPALGAWPAGTLSDAMQVLLAGFLLGEPPAALSGQLAHADELLRELFGTPPRADALASTADDELLALAEGFVPPQFAPLLADRLAQRSLLPRYERLAALLAVHDGARCDALLARLEASDVRPTDRFIELVSAAMLAAIDAKVAVPSRVEQAWQSWETQPPPTHHFPAWFAGRLRLEARRDPVAALALLTEAVDEVGAAEIGVALEAVVFRAVRVNPAAVWRHFAEDAATLTHRARLIAALGRAGEHDAAALDAVLADLQSPRTPGDRHPREVWASAGALLELAAATGDGVLGERVIAAAGPEPWTIFVSTRFAAHERALRKGRWDPELWTRLARAAERSGPGRAAQAGFPPTPWSAMDASALAACWQLETLPLPELVWFRWWPADAP